jgi:hypothetical protein
MCVYMHSRFVENHPIWIPEDGPLISEVVLSHSSSVSHHSGGALLLFCVTACSWCIPCCAGPKRATPRAHRRQPRSRRAVTTISPPPTHTRCHPYASWAREHVGWVCYGPWVLAGRTTLTCRQLRQSERYAIPCFVGRPTSLWARRVALGREASAGMGRMHGHFQPIGQFVNRNSFSITIWFKFKFKLQNFVSFCWELQKSWE